MCTVSLLKPQGRRRRTGSGSHLQHQALVVVVGAGSPLQGGEGHVASGQRGDVTELVRAQGGLLVVSRPDEGLQVLPVGLPAGAAVILVGQPRAVLLRALVDGEALWPAGVELQSDVGDLKLLAWGRHTGRLFFICVSKSDLKLRPEPLGLHRHIGACYVRDKYVGVTVWCPGA